jgi:hypothetical protein
MEPLNTPLNDEELKRVLQQWKAPDAPASLERRVLGEPWWRWLLTGSVRVPVPVGMALLAALGTALYFMTPRETNPRIVKGALTLADFQPVETWEPKIVRTHEGN